MSKSYTDYEDHWDEAAQEEKEYFENLAKSCIRYCIVFIFGLLGGVIIYSLFFT